MSPAKKVDFRELVDEWVKETLEHAKGELPEYRGLVQAYAKTAKALALEVAAGLLAPERAAKSVQKLALALESDALRAGYSAKRLARERASSALSLALKLLAALAA